MVGDRIVCNHHTDEYSIIQQKTGMKHQSEFFGRALLERAHHLSLFLLDCSAVVYNLGELSG